MLTAADLRILNPYDPANDSQAAMDAAAAIRQREAAHGTRFQIELLYDRQGHVAGRRLGLKDASGFFAEYFFHRDGRIGDAKYAVRHLVNVHGKAPAFWAVEAL